MFAIAAADRGRPRLGALVAARSVRLPAGRAAVAPSRVVGRRDRRDRSRVARVCARRSRCRALEQLYGIGPILASILVAEIGDVRRFRRAGQIVRLAGLDPVVSESADSRRRGHLAKAGSPHLRWALVEAAIHARRVGHLDYELHRRVAQRAGATPARLTAARKIGRRAFHVLRELELRFGGLTSDRGRQPDRRRAPSVHPTTPPGDLRKWNEPPPMRARQHPAPPG